MLADGQKMTEALSYARCRKRLLPRKRRLSTRFSSRLRPLNVSHRSHRDLSVRPSGRASAFWQRLRSGDDIAYVITLTCALTILAITALLVFELYTKSAVASSQVWMVVSHQHDLGSGRRSSSAHLPFIYGTVVTSALALLMGIPLGVGAAIFLAELAPQNFECAHLPD